MGTWRAETETDLSEAEKLLEEAIANVAGDPSPDQVRSVWLAYLKVEKSVAFIKFDLEEENPGRFIRLKAYSVPDERQAIRFALKSLKKGKENFLLGDFKTSLKDLRESRNYLRALLRERRLAKNRSARKR